MLIRTREVTGSLQAARSTFVEWGLDRSIQEGVEYITAGGLDISGISPAEFGVESIAQSLAVNWPKVPDACGQSIKLDPFLLEQLLTEASIREVNTKKWRKDLGLDRACT